MAKCRRGRECEKQRTSVLFVLARQGLSRKRERILEITDVISVFLKPIRKNPLIHNSLAVRVMVEARQNRQNKEKRIFESKFKR